MVEMLGFLRSLVGVVRTMEKSKPTYPPQCTLQCVENISRVLSAGERLAVFFAFVQKEKPVT